MAIDADSSALNVTADGGVDEPDEDASSSEATAGQLDAAARAPDDEAEYPRKRADVRIAIGVGLLVVAALSGLVGWLGYGAYRLHQDQTQRGVFLQVARQCALNLTTINYTQAEGDVDRILDTATGRFRDDFQNRAKPFINVVKQAQSKSEGAIIDAGLESIQGDQARALIAVNVNTSLAGAPEPRPRAWRMRITVQRVDGGAKVSNVEFVQ